MSLVIPAFIVLLLFKIAHIGVIGQFSWWIITVPIWGCFLFYLLFFLLLGGSVGLWAVGMIAYGKLRGLIN